MLTAEDYAVVQSAAAEGIGVEIPELKKLHTSPLLETRSIFEGSQAIKDTQGKDGQAKEGCAK